MLGKLLKQDFRATARIMLPLYAAVPVLGLFTNLITRLCENQNGFLIRAIGALVSFVFSLSLIAAVVTTVVLMILRFYRNLMTDEGYLMFTLPAGMHSLLWSKLITAALFFIFTFLAEALSVAIVVWRGGLAREMFTGFADFFRRLDSYYMANGLAFALETLALLFVSLLVTCLLF